MRRRLEKGEELPMVEVVMNEECRSRKGLEYLIQKNWVSLGFPFSRRHQLCSRMGEVTLRVSDPYSFFTNPDLGF